MKTDDQVFTQRYLLNFFIMDNNWSLMTVRWWAKYTLLSCVCVYLKCFIITPLSHFVYATLVQPRFVRVCLSHLTGIIKPYHRNTLECIDLVYLCEGSSIWTTRHNFCNCVINKGHVCRSNRKNHVCKTPTEVWDYML